MNVGMILLGIYLIIVGLMSITPVNIPPIVPGILALIAGILIIVGR